MPRFTTRLVKLQTFGALGMDLPRDLTITPLSWSANDRGGCYQAEFKAEGSAESVASLTGWLGDRIEIYNEFGQMVWWGDVWDIEITLDHIEVRLSLDNVYNRVQIIYPAVLPDGTEISKRSLWAEDGNSVTRYGRRELLHSLSSTMGPAFASVREQLLAKFSYPGPIVSSRRDAGFSARLIGQGTWYKASSIYFANAKGLLEYTVENGQQTLGRSITSTAIQFGVIDTEADPDELVAGDEMTISGGSFYPLKADDSFTVRGGVAMDEDGRNNNDSHIVEAAPSTDKIIISGSFVPEAAGIPIQISWGYNKSQTILAQSFKITSAAWSATHVAVKVRQLRNMADPDNPVSPTDYFHIGIYADNAGVPWTLLAYQQVLGSTLYTELTWTEFALLSTLALTPGTTYWLGVRRSGPAGESITPHLQDGYELAISELEGHDEGYVDGQMKVSDGATWVERLPRADMCFRIIGEVDSSVQMVAALESVDSFSTNIVQLETGIMVRPYRDDGRTAMDELDELLEAGTEDGKRLISIVMADRSVVVDTARPIEESEFTLGADGRMRTANGSPILPGQLVYGQHVQVDTLLLLDGVGVRLEHGRSLYIQSSSYDARSDSLMVQSLGALDPYEALSYRQG
jgi:hypothetical protein